MIDIYSIELPNRRCIVFNPVFTIIIRNINTTIITINKVVWIFRVNPKGMMIGMYIFCTYRCPRLTTIFRFYNRYTIDINIIFIRRRHMDMSKIIAITKINSIQIIVVCFLPRLSSVCAFIYLCTNYRSIK